MGTSSSKELQQQESSNATTGTVSSGTLSDVGGGGSSSVVTGSPPSTVSVIGHRRQGSFAKQEKQQKTSKKKNQRQLSSNSTSTSTCSSNSNSRRPSSSFDKSQSHSSSSIDTNLGESNTNDFIDNNNNNNIYEYNQNNNSITNSNSNSQSQLMQLQSMNDRSSTLSNQEYTNSTSTSLINTPNECQTPRTPNSLVAGKDNHHINSNSNSNNNNNNDNLSSSISSTSNSLSSMILHNDSSSSLRDHQIIICEHCHQISTSRPSSAFRPSSAMSNSIDFNINNISSSINNNNNNNNININRSRTNSTNRHNLSNSSYNPPTTTSAASNIINSNNNINNNSNNSHFSFNNSVNSTATFGYDSDDGLRNINQLTISNNSINHFSFADDDNNNTRISSSSASSSSQHHQQQHQQQQPQSNSNNNNNNQLKSIITSNPPSLNNSFSNFNNLPMPNTNNIPLSISSPSIITPTTNRLSNGLQLTPFPPSTFNNNNSNNQDNLSTTSILHSSIGSTSELFNKSLISSFLNSNNQQQQQLQLQQLQQQQAVSHQQHITTQQQLQQQQSSSSSQPMYNSSISPPTTPRHYAPRDLSYDTKDIFTITVSNSEQNSMISDNSIGSIGSGFQRLTVSSSSHRSGGIKLNDHNMHNNTSSGSNDSLFFGAQKKEAVSDYTKDITFLHSEHDSVKEKSNLSTTSSSSSSNNNNNGNSHNHNRNHLSVSQQRPRGRSISDSLFMSSNSAKDCINDIQKALENEKIKKNRFNELKEILNDRNDIIEINDIQFVQKVGEGAFSEVWEGWWKGIHVAVKKLKIIGDEEQFKERFLREVENLKRGNHQNIVMFMGACYKPACIITEYMSGGSLYNVLHNPNTPKVKYSFPLVLKMATDIALGLAHLHTLNIVHRDLTSQNILLDELGNLKISDFGLSREKPRDGSMTMTNGGICNPRWRPPEITKNLGHYSEKMDVYCFSLVVWELLVGEIPFSDLDGSQASAQVAYAGLRPTIPDNCDKDFADLLVQCWDTDPAKRPLFPYIVSKLKEISWNNPIGFVSERDSSESSTPRSLSPIKN